MNALRARRIAVRMTTFTEPFTQPAWNRLPTALAVVAFKLAPALRVQYSITSGGAPPTWTTRVDSSKRELVISTWNASAVASTEVP